MVTSLGNIAGGNAALWYLPLHDARQSYIPQTMAELNGLGAGIVAVPRHLHPVPNREVHVMVEAEALPMYANVIENATASPHMGYLNRHLLLRYWSRLRLRPATRVRWEERFPNLR